MDIAKVEIKDNSKIDQVDLKGLNNLVNKISNKTLGQLEREGVFVFPKWVKESEDLSKEQYIIEQKDDGYHTGNIMGFIGCDNGYLQIKSRFCKGEDFFFRYLMSKILNAPNLLELKVDIDYSGTIFNYLILLFPSYLKQAMRKGLLKKYITIKYNNQNVKGYIDISRHASINTPFLGNIAYNQRELTADNYVIELIRHTIEFIKRKPYGNKLLENAKEEIRIVCDVTRNYSIGERKSIVEANRKNIIKHPYYSEYTVLQKLCIMVLQQNKYSLFSGKDKVYGVLFDGSWLWEEYINILLSDKFYHPTNRKGGGGQRLFSININDKKIGLIYPDFIGKEQSNKIIADAKYKPVKNIGNRDYLQLLAYMYRFDSKKGYFLYPEADNNEDLCLRLNSGSTYENNVLERNDVFIKKHGLKIPSDVTNYDKFCKAMNDIEKSFVEEF